MISHIQYVYMCGGVCSNCTYTMYYDINEKNIYKPRLLTKNNTMSVKSILSEQNSVTGSCSMYSSSVKNAS